MQEKIRRTDKVSIDMQIVEQLKTYRGMRNCQLEGTNQFCNLFPDMNKRVCKGCPKTMREMCETYKKEREYIHSQEETKGTPRRQRKQQNLKRIQSDEISAQIADEDEAYLYEDQDVDSMAEQYPCRTMYFACPDKDFCEFGEKCPYDDSKTD